MSKSRALARAGAAIACAVALWSYAAPSVSATAEEAAIADAQRKSMQASQAIIERAYARKDSAAELSSIAPMVHFEAVNPREPSGDRLGPARRLAAAIVAQDTPAPHLIVDVGSFTGEFLEAFMQRFPDSHGQWTEPVTNNLDNAKKRLGRFKSVDFVVGCASRDISQGCVPKGVDVLITSWLSIHQNLAGIRSFYKQAAGMLPSGGWLANIDHVTYGKGSPWENRVKGAREELVAAGVDAVVEGPPTHHPDYVTPTLDDQVKAFKDAGFDDVQVVWRRLDTVLFMARKK
jgi:hypothetical protein